MKSKTLASTFGPASDKPPVLTVKELTFSIKNRLEREYFDVWVSGEVGKVTDHASGIYFSLKDEDALIDGVIWRREVRKVLSFDLETGTQVIVHGHIDLYVKRGQYKIIVDHIEPKGVGLLQKKFEALKKKLEGEGLFSAERKRELPFLPKAIGIVTAKEGAAIDDMMETIFDRFPQAHIVFRPSRVQGDTAAREIAKAIEELNQHPDVEVMIVGRGGGSLEDLWAFNEEVVARAIANSRVPVISAVGHEQDVSISDFVADVRAKTPTDAGMIVIPEWDELVDQLQDLQKSLVDTMEAELLWRKEKLSALENHWVMRRPVDLLQNLRQQLDHYHQVLGGNLYQQFASIEKKLVDLSKRLNQKHPSANLQNQFHEIRSLFARLAHLGEKRIQKEKNRYLMLAEKLEGRSPVAILSRGYSLSKKEGSPSFLTQADQVKAGDVLETILHHGKIKSVVKSTEKNH